MLLAYFDVKIIWYKTIKAYFTLCCFFPFSGFGVFQQQIPWLQKPENAKNFHKQGKQKNKL